MAEESLTLWKELEETSGEELLLNIDCLTVYNGRSKEALKTLIPAMIESGLSYAKYTGTEAKEHFPLVNFDDESTVLHDTNSCALLARRCMMTLMRLFILKGGILRDGEKVTQVQPGVNVALTTNKRSYTSKHVVLAPGPWANDVLRLVDLHLPLKTLPALPCYWKETIPGSHSNLNGMPMMLEYLDVQVGYQFIYAFPSIEYPGMIKVATRGEPALDPMHPDNRDQQDRAKIINQLSNYIENRLPGVEPTPAVTEGCMYTRTPDGNFVIDRHPRFSNVLIAAGGSGHGFKMAPVVGKLVHELLQGTSLSYSRDLFRWDRFNSMAKL